MEEEARQPEQFQVEDLSLMEKIEARGGENNYWEHETRIRDETVVSSHEEASESRSAAHSGRLSVESIAAPSTRDSGYLSETPAPAEEEEIND